MLTDAKILDNRQIKDGFFRIDMEVPEIALRARPGQFVHLKIGELKHRILRRPFSIFDVSSDGCLSVIYKVVGEGTEMLSRLSPGTVCSIIGPLGKPFTIPSEKTIPVIIAGGYGAAATYMLAQQSPTKGFVFIGAKNSYELLLENEFKELGFNVSVSTDDGSAGKKGFVTVLLEDFFKTNEKNDVNKFAFFACGPVPMLKAVSRILARHKVDGELSLDQNMCCGIGACFACVHKIKDKSSETGWRYARVCKEGPVFKSSDIIFD